MGLLCEPKTVQSWLTIMTGQNWLQQEIQFDMYKTCNFDWNHSRLLFPRDPQTSHQYRIGNVNLNQKLQGVAIAPADLTYKLEYHIAIALVYMGNLQEESNPQAEF